VIISDDVFIDELVERSNERMGESIDWEPDDIRSWARWLIAEAPERRALNGKGPFPSVDVMRQYLLRAAEYAKDTEHPTETGADEDFPS